VVNADEFIGPAQRSTSPDTRQAERLAALARQLDRLNDLIMALDRRVPQVQRAGEAAVATAAAELRMEAAKRITEIEGELARH
jgi:hypothetical protein